MVVMRLVIMVLVVEEDTTEEAQVDGSFTSLLVEEVRKFITELLSEALLLSQ